MKTNTHFWSYLTHFFLEWEMFRTKLIGEIKTHVLCSINFFSKSCFLWDNVEKYRESQTDRRWPYNAAHAHCVPPPPTHTHTPVSNNYCLATAKIFTWTCPVIALYVSCHMSCSGLAWILELLPGKHKETDMWHASPFRQYSLETSVLSHKTVKCK
jgi:hypothetical protein